MDQVLDIVKLNNFVFLKKEVEEFGQQSQNLDCENRRLEHKVEILKNPNNICECITTFYSFSISKEKIDQVMSGVLSKLAKKILEGFDQLVSKLG